MKDSIYIAFIHSCGILRLLSFYSKLRNAPCTQLFLKAWECPVYVAFAPSKGMLSLRSFYSRLGNALFALFVLTAMECSIYITLLQARECSNFITLSPSWRMFHLHNFYSNRSSLTTVKFYAADGTAVMMRLIQPFLCVGDIAVYGVGLFHYFTKCSFQHPYLPPLCHSKDVLQPPLMTSLLSLKISRITFRLHSSGILKLSRTL